MGLRTWLCWTAVPTILFMLIQCGRAEEEVALPCEMTASSSNQTWWREGGDVDLFCECSNAGKDVSLKEHLTMKFDGNEVVISEVDNSGTTFKGKPGLFNQNAQLKFECYFDTYLLNGFHVKVFAQLNVTDFECRYRYHGRAEISCTFTRLDDANFWDLTHYELMADNTPLACSVNKNNATKIQCTVDINGNDLIPDSMIFRLTMLDTLGNQTQEFNRTKDEMTELEWPADRYINHTCVSWNHIHVQGSTETLEWDVQLQCVKYPQLVKNLTRYTERIPKDTTDRICFENLEGNQKFMVRLKRRLNVTGAPWSEQHPEIVIETDATRPARPPKFLPLGYHYNQDNHELRVYWEPLEELEFNAPELDYEVTTNTGKLGKYTDRTSTVFKEWDYENPATVFVASRNIKGISVNRSRLEVPELSDAMDRRCQDLAHDDNTQILTWTKPVEEKNLEGYFVYWCNKTTCQADATTELKYDLSDMSPIRMAVAANYGADKSGGMKWLREDKVGVTGRIRYVEGILALLVLGVFFLGVRKLRSMAKIDVKVPPGVLMPSAPFDPDQSRQIQPHQGIPHPRMLYSDLKQTEPPDDYPDVQIEVEFEVEVEAIIQSSAENVS
ncbi:cytokine receptor [Drosophila gunungcola]|uniref:cytokine receptor n=1 Tax=Drosophila gunungcola TaxID=103775 RepID=UPI0022E95C0C|nr:cytokine receptor [Drosophila gunungcola]